MKTRISETQTTSKMLGRVLAIVLLSSLAPQALAHGAADADSQQEVSPRHIQFPDVEGYQTLVVDLHSHSVFSDGHVWPKIRVEEALRDGLDGFAVTEHLEWQPHRADIPHPDRNRAFAEASTAAQGTQLIVIPGSEITRDLPAGHINAVFVTDSNALLQVDEPPADTSDVPGYYKQASQWPAAEAVAAANAQNAFVFINHPDWPRQRPSGVAELTKLQRQLIKDKQIHGIEIANGNGFSTQALAIGLQRDLALLGVSDIHELIDWDYPPAEGAHRPVTLVFATERSAQGIHDALRARRNLVWFKNRLIGRPAELQPLLEASLRITEATTVAETETVAVTFRNASDVHFELRNLTDYSLAGSDDRFSVAPHSDHTIVVRPGKRMTDLALAFEVENALTAPAEHPQLRYQVAIAQP